jgi:cytosine/adenosine deaminase-related metal-dependent hydrolase
MFYSLKGLEIFKIIYNVYELMAKKYLFSKFALIGDNLDLKQNVNIEVDQKGIIIDLSYDDVRNNIEILPKHQTLLMIPGFINSHVHIGDTFAKELGYNKDLKEIVAPPFGLKHKLLRTTPEEIKLRGIQNAIFEMLSNGITLFIDFREGGESGINLLKSAIIDNPIDYLAFGRFMDDSEIDSIFKIANGLGLSSYKKITSTNKDLVLSAKKKYKKLIACHCAENIRNNNLIERLFNDNLVDIIIHGTKFTKKDLIRLIDKKISLVLCPRSNGYFGTGFPPISEIINNNIPVSLGTDNMMVNNSDLFEEIRYFYRISRVLCQHNKNLQITSKELIKMVTINAAKGFCIDSTYGSISIGKFANLFFIDLGFPNFFISKLDTNNIYNLITQRTKSENIIKTYIRGEAVFERI